MNKADLRSHIRVLKRQMTEAEIAAKSASLKAQLLQTEAYRKAKTLYGYVNYNQEVRTLPILEQALQDGKRVAVPKCYGSEMRFIYISSLRQLAKGSFGIPEPIGDGPVGDDPQALVLMPGLAFDYQGHRIGYGGGYYDKFLSQEPEHPTIALCYDFQVRTDLETDEFDISVDTVLWA